MFLLFISLYRFYYDVADILKEGERNKKTKERYREIRKIWKPYVLKNLSTTVTREMGKPELKLSWVQLLLVWSHI